MKIKILIITLFLSILIYLLIVFPLQYEELGKKKFTYTLHPSKNVTMVVRDMNKSLFVAHEALKGYYYFNHHDVDFSFYKDLDTLFNRDTFDNNTHELYTQSLIILDDLLIAHQKEHNNKYLLIGLRVINSWIEQSSRFNYFQSNYTWSDHSSSNRTISVVNFLDYASYFIDINETTMTNIIQMMNTSAGYLSNKYNYRNINNHGVFQDFALLKISNHIMEQDIADKYAKLSLVRFNKQISSIFSPMGIELENSPGYHMWITDLSKLIVLEAKKFGKDKFIDKQTLNTLAKADCNKYFFLTHTNMIPPVGDSIKLKYYDYKKCTDINDTLIDKVAGYSIYKDKTNYLLIRTQSPYNTHRHLDNMSFLFEDNNETIISEVGFLDYTNSKDRRYTITKKAHNKVYLENDDKRHSSKFIDIRDNKNNFITKISTEIDSKQSIIRTIILDKNISALIIQDKITGKMNSHWIKTLHYGKSVKNIQHFNNHIQITTNKNNIYYLHTYISDKKISEKIIQGSLEPKLGWSAIPFRKLVPSYASYIELSSKNNYNIVSILCKEKNPNFKKYMMLLNDKHINAQDSIFKTDNRNRLKSYEARFNYFVKFLLCIVLYTSVLLLMLPFIKKYEKFIYLPYMLFLFFGLIIYWMLLL